MSNTRTAVDFVWNEKKKVYQLIMIEYNYLSKKTEIRRAKDLAENEHMAIYKAKEMVVKNIMGLKNNEGDLKQTILDQHEHETKEDKPKTEDEL